jgi:hypothetical protein
MSVLTVLKRCFHSLRKYLNRPVVETLREYTPPNAASQIALSVTYRLLAASGASLPSVKEVGFKAYSQTDEDGILLFIFSILGATRRTCVEICAGNGIECNTANLIINHGWTGLLLDGNPEVVRQGKEFYQANPATYADPPTFLCGWVKRDSINRLLTENDFTGEIDLLSLDLDGVDYWIWQAIEVINPRVVVLEYQDIIGPEKSLTVPYADDFDAYKYPTTHGAPNYSGASLPAFVKLGRRKGYRLVGCNRSGYNAFFVRKDLGQNQLPEILAAECFTKRKVIQGMKERWPLVKDLPWVEV